MPFYFGTFLSVIIVLLALFHDDFMQFWLKTETPREVTFLAIGILSAQENFKQREAARATWLKNLPENNKDVKPFFIVGNSSCNVPPEYRLSIYECEKWNINISGIHDYFYTASVLHSDTCSSSLKKIFHQGFSFQVNYPVVVTKLGIYSHLLLKDYPARIAVMDIHNMNIIIQATVTTNETKSVNGYIYVDVETILLPKHYEGLLLVEGYLKEDDCSGDVIWNDGGGVITFKRIYSNPHHLDSKKFSPNFSTAASIGFYVPDLTNFTKIANEEELITKKWNQKLKALNEQLITEAIQRKDILFVDVIDTYRTLPVKLLHFYKWLHLHHNYSYVMKTDDDCVIDINRIHKILMTDSKFDTRKSWVWSRFRKDWPVNYMGKWTDFEYRSSYYPSFPCGASYVMSRGIVEWLSSNIEHLYTYQGEDVSLGIWLSAINPIFIEDENFECGIECKKNSYNRAQLNPSQVYEVWSGFKECEDLCSCNASSSHDNDSSHPVYNHS